MNHQQKFLKLRGKNIWWLKVPFTSHIGCLYIFKDIGLVQKEQQADGKEESRMAGESSVRRTGDSHNPLHSCLRGGGA